MATRVAALFVGGFTLGSGIKYCQQSTVHALSERDFQKGAACINAGNYNRFERAKEGRTVVFLLKDLPIVLKASGNKSDDRLAQMEAARELCKTLGTAHLVIPEARKHGCFLIEDQLPLMGVGYLEQMVLYAQNKEKFTQAIRDLTAFLCRAELSDIWMRHDAHLLYGKVPSDVARFANIPLYIENGEGKIGLIDLEGLTIPQSYAHWSDDDRNTNSIRSATARSDWSALITIFPYHFEDILDVAQKMNPWMRVDKEYRELLESQRNDALETYKVAYRIGGGRRFFFF